MFRVSLYVLHMGVLEKRQDQIGGGLGFGSRAVLSYFLCIGLQRIMFLL